MTSKNKEQKIEEQVNLEKIISDYGSSKYSDTVLAMQWANHLKFTEEYRLKPLSDIIEIALKDIFLGKVTREEVLKETLKDNKIKEERFQDRRKEKRQERIKNTKKNEE